MKLSIREKKVLYAFACPNHHNTVTRLKWLTALTVDPQAKHRMLELARKMETEMAESWYTGFYHQLRAEMDEYYHAKRRLRLVKENTEYEEDLYDEAVYVAAQDEPPSCVPQGRVRGRTGQAAFLPAARAGVRVFSLGGAPYLCAWRRGGVVRF